MSDKPKAQTDAEAVEAFERLLDRIEEILEDHGITSALAVERALALIRAEDDE